MEKEKQYSFSLNTNYNSNNYKRSLLAIKLYSMKISIVILSVLLLILPPLLYVSFLHIPPSTLFHDTTFWFLMSNSIILFIVADTNGMFFVPSLHDIERELYEDPVAYGKSRNVSSCLIDETATMVDKSVVISEKLIQDRTSFTANDEHEYTLSSCIVEENEENKKKELTNHDEVAELETSGASIVRDSESMKKAVQKVKSFDPLLHNRSRRRRSVDTLSEKRLRRSITQHDERHDYEKLSDEELNKKIEEFIKRYYREMRLQLSNESMHI